jgi:Glycosyl hydrolases family 35
MPTVTHDGRSFLLDGRRLWLASGSISYSRVPRESWKDRVHAAKSAGLNCIDVPIFWNKHEPRANKFDFKGDNDLRHFIEIIAHAGMYAMLRIGPFVGDGWDMGGLPAWLTENPNLKLRTGNQPYLEACSRFINAIADQVKDKQITTPGSSGPIILVQCESEWTCGSAHAANDYLGELNRYFRESGLVVPIINANNLWQSVEGEIETWTGTEEMLAAMRQFTVVKADTPRIVSGFSVGKDLCWGQDEPKVLGQWAIQRRLAEVLAGGAQFNIRPFVGGTNPGFLAGRSAESPDAFVVPRADHGAMVVENGGPGHAYTAVRRVAHFASRFGRVLANMDPMYKPVVIDPAAAAGSLASRRAKATSDPRHCSIVHGVGPQGSVAFVFSENEEEGEPNARTFPLLLPDGSTLPVTLSQQSVGWCLFNVIISGRATLDYCNINAFAAVGQVFVAFGPAGSRAMLSVNGSPIEVGVPSGAAPTIITHEGLTVVAVSEQVIDHTFVTDQAVFVGVSGLNAEGTPLPLPGEKTCTKIAADGKVTKVNFELPKAPAVALVDRLPLSNWSRATCSDYCDGSSARFATIAGPADLAKLGCASGYGWYKITLDHKSAAKVMASAPESGDRLQFFADGEPLGVMGLGPGASEELSLPLKRGPQSLVILAENLGRFAGGTHLGERKGLFGHIWELAPLKLAKPKLVRSEPMDILSLMSPVWEVREGDATLPDRLTWSIGKRKSSVVVHIGDLGARAFLMVNEKVAALIDRGGPRRVLIPHDQLQRAHNDVQLAFLGDAAGSPASEEMGDAITFSDAGAAVTQDADFAFAKWEAPAEAAFEQMSAKSAKAPGPAWWRCTFKVGSTHMPLYFEPSGLTKGQLYINGVHISRYFVATSAGKAVPPQERYFIPDSRLHHGKDNTLLIFDEHGSSPSRAKLVYDTAATPIKA